MNSDDIKNDLFSQFPLLKEIDDKLSEAKNHNNLYESCLQEAKDKFALLNTVDIPEIQLLDFLSVYLLLEPLIPVSLIKQAIGAGKVNNKKYMNLPKKFHYLCPRCNRKVPFHSRTSAQLYLSGVIGEELYCDLCKAEIDQEKNQRHILEREKYAKSREVNQRRLQELKNMRYSKYLQTPEWKEIRNRKMKRAKYRCQLCSKHDKLNVHHTTYENRGNENDGDLIVLCEDCHKLYHEKGKIKEETAIYSTMEAINE